MSHPIYLDYNATTPHDPEVIEAMRPFLETHFGNPSSSHQDGLVARDAVEHARAQVASLLNCEPGEIIFTSGGTESNNYAIKGIALSRREHGNHIITSTIEHPAAVQVCRHLETCGFQITWIPVDETGMINVNDVEAAIRPETVLITIMHANNEVGTIQPIGDIARKGDIAIHTDAAQSVGKILADVKSLNVDLLTIAGHKIYAPKGIGALFIKRGIELEPIIHGAGQERGLRPGTENVLEIVGLGKACEVAKRDLEQNLSHMSAMRDRLARQITESLDDVRRNGHSEQSLPNTLSLSFLDIEANKLLEQISDRVAASAGAACHSGGVTISSVLKAMQVPEEWAKGTIRLSTGRKTTAAEIDTAASVIIDAVKKTRAAV